MTSPKGHPELAGVGIEYNWGGRKLRFRRDNDCVPKKHSKNAKASFTVLTLSLVRKYARKARSYPR